MIETESTPQIDKVIPPANAESILSAPAQERAAIILKEATAAKEAGDESRLVELRQQVEADPELSEAVAHGSGSSEQPIETAGMPKQSAEDARTTEQPTGSAENTLVAPEDLATVRRVQADLSQKWQQLHRLSQGALSAGVPTESLFTKDEIITIIGRMTGLEDAIDDGESLGAVGDAIQAFSAWYEQAHLTVQAKTHFLKGYFGGRLPGALIAQAQLFDAMEDDVGNLKHYFNLIQE